MEKSKKKIDKKPKFNKHTGFNNPGWFFFQKQYSEVLNKNGGWYKRGGLRVSKK